MKMKMKYMLKRYFSKTLWYYIREVWKLTLQYKEGTAYFV